MKLTTSRQANNSTWQTNRTWMKQLYNRLNSAYPIRWKSHFIDERSIDQWRETWAAALDRERITGEQVRIALERCETIYEWPPSLPEFIRECKAVVLVDPDQRALPAPRMTNEQRQRGLAMLRAATASWTRRPHGMAED
jgi:hypothetical protein